MVTTTAPSSPAAVPAVPVSIGVAVSSVAPVAGLSMETVGAVASTGVVSTVNVTAELRPVLPAWSV